MRYKRLLSAGQEGQEEIALFHLVSDNTIQGDDFIANEDDVQVLIKSEEKLYRFLGLYYGYVHGSYNDERKAMMRLALDDLIENGKLPSAVKEMYKY